MNDQRDLLRANDSSCADRNQPSHPNSRPDRFHSLDQINVSVVKSKMAGSKECGDEIRRTGWGLPSQLRFEPNSCTSDHYPEASGGSHDS
jgi:hypothetical protein